MQFLFSSLARRAADLTNVEAEAGVVLGNPLLEALLWMDEILHHFETMVEAMACGYLQRNRIRNQGF